MSTKKSKEKKSNDQVSTVETQSVAVSSVQSPNSVPVQQVTVANDVKDTPKDVKPKSRGRKKRS